MFNKQAISATESTSRQASHSALYRQYVNPRWAEFLNLLRLDHEYIECVGEDLTTRDNRRMLDFSSGYCVYNIGHNHPHVRAALHQELDSLGPSMLQNNTSTLAGQLAQRLVMLAGGKLGKVYFSTSGAEGVEAAMKFARSSTGRGKLLAARGAYHGLTYGALSLMEPCVWTKDFGEMLPGVEHVSFGSLPELGEKLNTKKFAGFIVEPIQGEGGVILPPDGYLQAAQQLCEQTGTLFILDEVQTGLCRTGRFLAAHHYDVSPDIVVLAKALSGGAVPVGAVLMSDKVYSSVYRDMGRALIHTSTFSEASLAMRSGLATLDVLESEHLAERALSLGDLFRSDLREALRSYELVHEVRGLGHLTAISFGPPRSLSLKLAYHAFNKLHPILFGQLVVRRLNEKHGCLTQLCGNAFTVLKVSPPLNVRPESLSHFTRALVEVMDHVHHSKTFWSEGTNLVMSAASSPS